MPENKPAGLLTGTGTGPEATNNKRVRLTSHMTNVPNAVLVGYARLSDGARVTYMVLESYDWPDKDGFSKGCCWPTIESISAARGKSYDTISRHLKELETAGLIRVESGQENGTHNCYWLLGPSPEEFAAYLARFPETAPVSDEPDALEEPPAKMPHPVPQIYGTPSRKNAAPGPAKMRDKEHEFKEHEFKELNFKKLEFEKDSNPIHSHTDANTNFNAGFSTGAGGSRGGVNLTGQPRSQYISQVLLDFSKSLNDLPHSFSNQSQAQNLFRQSGLDERTFVEMLYNAKKRTQWAAMANPKTTGSGPNRAAYFFKVLRNLLEERHRSSPVP